MEFAEQGRRTLTQSMSKSARTFRRAGVGSGICGAFSSSPRCFSQTLKLVPWRQDQVVARWRSARKEKGGQAQESLDRQGVRAYEVGKRELR